MKIEYDEVKNQANIRKHGFSLNAFELLDFNTMQIEQDIRQNYGELRLRGYAYLQNRLCTSVFTMRGKIYRIISFRKASEKEIRDYDKKR